MKINLLDPTVYNRIAAGEVVENPASAIKELVENSIDAGATQISIYIEQGGIKSIEIVDNGCGIDKDELHKTILPHATSKILSAEDLYSISTLGFRGEALASIASVSNIEIKSKSIGGDVGAKLTAKGGENVQIVDTAYTQGTSIIISNLFYNTPARFKFLKGVKTEEGYVTKAVSQLILANPHISIKYFADGKQIYFSDGEGMQSAISAVYSAEICQNLISLEGDAEYPIQIGGYISAPTLYKNNRNSQTIILNGRVVADANFSATVSNAYGERLMQRCFPIFIINIVMRFDEVDVNVHPNKREVRFANPRQVYGAVYNAVKYTLEAYECRAKESFVPKAQKDEVLAAVYTKKDEAADKTDAYLGKSQQATFVLPDKTVLDVSHYLDKMGDTDTLKVADFADIAPIKTTFPPNTAIGEPALEPPTPAPQAKSQTIVDYKIIGQIFDTYIAVERADTLLLVDQHAAHERLLYDKLKLAAERGQPASQPLLIPYIYEDTPLRIAEILDISAKINALGFEIEPFGNNTIKINAVPSILTDTDPREFIEEIISGFASREFAKEELIREKIMQKACKSAIKGGYTYTKEQTEGIIRYFFESGMPLQCPHGRPTYITFSKAELEKLFRRKL